MANTEKKSFVVYTDYKKHLKLLPFDEVGKLFMSLLEYVETGESNQNLSPVANMALSFIQDQLDRDLEKYEETCAKNRENGKKGGRPKTKAEDFDKNPTVSEKTERLNSKPKKAYNDSEDVSDSDIKNDIDTDSYTGVVSDSDVKNDVDTDAYTGVVSDSDESGDVDNSDDIAKTENTAATTTATATTTEREKQKINPKEDKTSRDIVCYSVTENGATIEYKNPLIPTPEEVRNYCLERKSCIDPERFYTYYHIRDWKVGEKPMDDWKACVRVWEKKEDSGYNDRQNTQSPPPPPPPPRRKPKNSYLDYEQREYTEEELKNILRRKKLLKA